MVLESSFCKLMVMNALPDVLGEGVLLICSIFVVGKIIFDPWNWEIE